MRAHSLRLAVGRFATLSAVVAFAIPAAAGAAGPSSKPGPEVCSAEYVIGPEDVLDIAVWNNAEITRTVPVRPDGKISLPLLDDVDAAGLTPMQLRDTLAKSLARYIATLNVSVIVREVHSFKVSVIGEVKTPGRYELKSRSTVLDVLAMAGGLTEFASRDRIAVLREESETTRQIPVPYEKLTATQNSKEESKSDRPANLCMRPGDVILVP
jgi:polysaccharide biosynthesis/export protein